MQTTLIFFIAYQLAASVLNGDQTFHREVYAEIESDVILSCNMSKEASKQSWRKNEIVLSQGFEINKSIRGHYRFHIITDQSFYNLKICNITKQDFGTYWCETQQVNSIRAEGTKIIHSVLNEDQVVLREMYAEIESDVILSCNMSKEASKQSWRKNEIVLSRGFEINKSIRGHSKFNIITDQSFYNLKICNITEQDFGTYWCETQQNNSIRAEGTQLFHSGSRSAPRKPPTSDRKTDNTSSFPYLAEIDRMRTSQVIVVSTVNPYEETSTVTTNLNADTTTDRQWMSIKSTLSDSSTSETTNESGMFVDKSFFNGLCATGFAVLCLSVCGNFFFIKSRASISRRRKINSHENENQDVLQGNASNDDTANDTTLGVNENLSSHYETINENELIGMSHAPTSQHLSNLPRVSNIVQSLTQGDMYLEVIEETNNQMLAPRTKINGDKYHVSSPREERNSARHIYFLKNEKDDKCNTINKEFPVTIERNNFEDCKTSTNSISLSSSFTSEQSAGETTQERDKKASEHPNQYLSLNVNEMEYLNSYSTLITEK